MFNLFVNIADFQRAAFGDFDRRVGVLNHLEKELVEVRADLDDPEEWIDLIFLAFHGYWMTRCRGNFKLDSHMLTSCFDSDLEAKLRKNLEREWPQSLVADPTAAVEHRRD